MRAKAPAATRGNGHANGAVNENDVHQAVAALLAERGTLTNGELQAALGLDGAAARALLKGLVAAGIARQEGERRGTRYVWAGGAPQGAEQMYLDLADTPTTKP